MAKLKPGDHTLNDSPKSGYQFSAATRAALFAHKCIFPSAGLIFIPGKKADYQAHQPVKLHLNHLVKAPVLAAVTAAKSCGAMVICRPRTPELTTIWGNLKAAASR